ncbi:MAG TPA: DUF6285 domain-containing protein [Burkholderiaceae bacterium]|nr:DUF6285 domain-containing protein [Burkholderiaceae bacterium]
METKPGVAELLEAVDECLRRELLPALSGRAAFQARVCASVLGIARRELLAAGAADAAEARRLGALLSTLGAGGSVPGTPGTDLEPARRALCEAIRDGRADLALPGLAEHLWADVLARVAIEQPAYPSFVRETSPTPPDPDPER